MSLQEILALLLIILVFVVSPGPGTLAVFGKSMQQGFIAAFFLSFGLILGDITYLVAVILSLDFFSNTIASYMDQVKIVGGMYLIYLGIQSWRSGSFKIKKNISKKGNFAEFVTGYLISMANPKVMVFYIAILPNFINLKNLSLLIASEIIIITFLGLMAGISVINLGASKIKNKLEGSDSNAYINRIVGSIMMVAGIWLALS
ncbi:MAG: LysE family translocator [Gammaproteobacteria bacterium]|jgi:threonine/homoserine/homoserine lactone efflux protein|nr:LysE family translocator [Gammaproteobacteria bacterium]